MSISGPVSRPAPPCSPPALLAVAGRLLCKVAEGILCLISGWFCNSVALKGFGKPGAPGRTTIPPEVVAEVTRKLVAEFRKMGYAQYHRFFVVPQRQLHTGTVAVVRRRLTSEHWSGFALWEWCIQKFASGVARV